MVSLAQAGQRAQLGRKPPLPKSFDPNERQNRKRQKENQDQIQQQLNQIKAQQENQNLSRAERDQLIQKELRQRFGKVAGDAYFEIFQNERRLTETTDPEEATNLRFGIAIARRTIRNVSKAGQPITKKEETPPKIEPIDLTGGFSDARGATGFTLTPSTQPKPRETIVASSTFGPDFFVTSEGRTIQRIPASFQALPVQTRSSSLAEERFRLSSLASEEKPEVLSQRFQRFQEKQERTKIASEEKNTIFPLLEKIEKKISPRVIDLVRGPEDFIRRGEQASFELARKPGFGKVGLETAPAFIGLISTGVLRGSTETVKAFGQPATTLRGVKALSGEFFTDPVFTSQKVGGGLVGSFLRSPAQTSGEFLFFDLTGRIPFKGISSTAIRKVESFSNFTVSPEFLSNIKITTPKLTLPSRAIIPSPIPDLGRSVRLENIEKAKLAIEALERQRFDPNFIPLPTKRLGTFQTELKRITSDFESRVRRPSTTSLQSDLTFKTLPVRKTITKDGFTVTFTPKPPPTLSDFSNLKVGLPKPTNPRLIVRDGFTILKPSKVKTSSSLNDLGRSVRLENIEKAKLAIEALERQRFDPNFIPLPTKRLGTFQTELKRIIAKNFPKSSGDPLIDLLEKQRVQGLNKKGLSGLSDAASAEKAISQIEKAKKAIRSLELEDLRKKPTEELFVDPIEFNKKVDEFLSKQNIKPVKPKTISITKKFELAERKLEQQAKETGFKITDNGLIQLTKTETKKLPTLSVKPLTKKKKKATSKVSFVQPLRTIGQKITFEDEELFIRTPGFTGLDTVQKQNIVSSNKVIQSTGFLLSSLTSVKTVQAFKQNIQPVQLSGLKLREDVKVNTIQELKLKSLTSPITSTRLSFFPAVAIAPKVTSRISTLEKTRPITSTRTRTIPKITERFRRRFPSKEEELFRRKNLFGEQAFGVVTKKRGKLVRVGGRFTEKEATEFGKITVAGSLRASFKKIPLEGFATPKGIRGPNVKLVTGKGGFLVQPLGTRLGSKLEREAIQREKKAKKKNKRF